MKIMKKRKRLQRINNCMVAKNAKILKEAKNKSLEKFKEHKSI